MYVPIYIAGDIPVTAQWYVNIIPISHKRVYQSFADGVSHRYFTF